MHESVEFWSRARRYSPSLIPEETSMSRSKSRVHPKYKTKYRVGNWPAYERSLVERGSIALWLSPDAMSAWRPAPTGRRGGPWKF